MEHPTGTVTFLFTDIEGSTRLWESRPEEMRIALASHDKILRDAIHEHGGYVFSTAGDAYSAAFAAPRAATDAAISVQRALAGQAWPDGVEIRVRMGLHTGEADERDGDYFGPALNRCARVMSAGHGGQVLLTAATAGMLAPESVELLDLGERHLKDLAEAERIFQLVHPQLRSVFPSLRTEDAAVGNLPTAVTSFIGRNGDLARLDEKLADARTVTLTGAGGVGKSRLALHAAAAAAPRFRDGAWLCELAPVGDPAAVWFAFGSVLGISERSGMSMRDSVLDGLRTKKALLVIDNAEHLVDEVANLVEALVHSCPHLVVLVTSREALGIDGEIIQHVRPLAVEVAPEADGVFEDPPALLLFFERARAANPDVADDPANRAAVEVICKRLDGLPLAIELAAAQTRAMTPTMIAERIDERFRLFTGGRRSSIERHQTLRATVDWSYGLLTPAQQVLFERLSVFAGGFTLEAVEAVCAGDPVDRFDVPALFRDLVDKSMVSTDLGGGTRFTLLETIRSHASERLLARGDTELVGVRHGEHFATFAETAAAEICTKDEAIWVSRLDADFDNIRVAVSGALERNDAAMASRMAVALQPSGLFHLRSEVFDWAERIEADAAQRGEGVPIALLEALVAAATIRGQYVRAFELLARCRETLDAGEDDPELRALLLMDEATIKVFRGELEAAIEHLQEAREVASRSLNPRISLRYFAFMTMSHFYAGHQAEAIEMLEPYGRAADRMAWPSAFAFYHYAMGEVLSADDPERGVDHLEQSLDFSRSVRNRYVEGLALVTLSSIRGRHGDPITGLTSLGSAVRFFVEAGNGPPLWTTLRNVCEILCRVGGDEPAAVLLGAQRVATIAPALFGEGERRMKEAASLLESRLGADRFASALARGEEMTLDEAADFALDALASASGA